MPGSAMNSKPINPGLSLSPTSTLSSERGDIPKRKDHGDKKIAFTTAYYSTPLTDLQHSLQHLHKAIALKVALLICDLTYYKAYSYIYLPKPITFTK